MEVSPTAHVLDVDVARHCVEKLKPYLTTKFLDIQESLTETSLNEFQAHTKEGSQECIDVQGKSQVLETIFNVDDNVEAQTITSADQSSGATYINEVWITTSQIHDSSQWIKSTFLEDLILSAESQDQDLCCIISATTSSTHYFLHPCRMCYPHF
jgi:hypothetical protein